MYYLPIYYVPTLFCSTLVLFSSVQFSSFLRLVGDELSTYPTHVGSLSHGGSHGSSSRQVSDLLDAMRWPGTTDQIVSSSD